MIIKVKLYGQFRLLRSDYDEQMGLLVDLSDRATGKDLLDHMAIDSRAALILSEHRIVTIGETLTNNMEVKLMHVVFGG